MEFRSGRINFKPNGEYRANDSTMNLLGCPFCAKCKENKFQSTGARKSARKTHAETAPPRRLLFFILNIDCDSPNDSKIFPKSLPEASRRPLAPQDAPKSSKPPPKRRQARAKSAPSPSCGQGRASQEIPRRLRVGNGAHPGPLWTDNYQRKAI